MAVAPIVVFAQTSISAAGDARAHTTKSPPMGESMKTVSDQLLQTSTPTNLIVSSEIKTVQKNDTPLKGEAVPVLTDEDVHSVGPYSYKISSDGSTRPTGDLSTWILLGGESSPAPLNMATIKKVPKPVDTTVSSFVQSYEPTSTTRKRKPTTERMSTTPTTESPIKLQDSKFKNKTPVIVGKIPAISTVKDKVEETTTPLPELPPFDNNTRFGTPVVTFPHVPPRQRPSANNTKKIEKPLTTKITSTAVVISKPSNNTTPMPSTVAPTISTLSSTTSTKVMVQNSTEIAQTTIESNNSTVKNTSVKKKKKKKNKNKRRPVKTSNGDVQSKIDDQSSKITALGRPLSTQIYDYLAREVMPNVGVGLVGLMLTAGLAGLLLYSPLGGVAIPMVPLRRTDSHVHGHSNVHSPGYVPPETDNSQPEEQVFGQVLSGMSHGHNPYSRERPDAVSKYKMSYQPTEYSVAHDVTKYNAPDTTKFSANDVTKYSAADTTKYSTHDGTKYAVVESTKYSAPDTNQYSEPDTSKYSTIDLSVPQEKVSYSSLDTPQEQTFEQTQDNHDQTYQNHHYDQLKFDSSNAYEQPKYQSTSQTKGTYQEDQSSFDTPKYPGYVQDVPKEDAVVVNYNFDNHRTDEKESSTTSSVDPTYSALQGVPKFYDPSVNSEQISVNVHQTVKMEHGPRNLRIRRQVDEHNEVDAQLPEETTPQPTQEAVTETTERQYTSDSNTTTASTTTASTKTASSESPPTNHNQFSFVSLLRRIAEVKLKMGIEILRNTAASFTQYVNAIQRRMAHMVRSLQKSNDRQHSESKQEQKVVPDDSNVANEEKRQRRSIRHRMYSN